MSEEVRISPLESDSWNSYLEGVKKNPEDKSSDLRIFKRNIEDDENYRGEVAYFNESIKYIKRWMEYQLSNYISSNEDSVKNERISSVAEKFKSLVGTMETLKDMQDQLFIAMYLFSYNMSKYEVEAEVLYLDQSLDMIKKFTELNLTAIKEFTNHMIDLDPRLAYCHEIFPKNVIY